METKPINIRKSNSTLLILIITIAVSVFSHVSVAGRNYYFSTSMGNDSRTSFQAQNPATPWKTIAKLNLYFNNLLPGDSILFKRGENFSGSIKALKSGLPNLPIVFSGYGSGSQPVISGFITLSSWTFTGNGIYQCPATSCKPTVNMVTVNGVLKAIGRYPNSGYLTFESHSGTMAITDDELTDLPNWTGAELVLRADHWLLDKHLITNHSGNTMTYLSSSNTSPKDNNGYFIQKDPKTLDSPGEWYFNPISKTMNMFMGTDNPASFLIKASSIDTLVKLNGFNNITFDDLLFEGANVAAFYIDNSQHITIKKCLIDLSGTDAIRVEGSSAYFSLLNSVINHTNNKSISTGTLCSNALISSNTIKNTALIPGMGASGSSNYLAIMSDGANASIEYNEIDSVGYTGISFHNNYSTISNNYIRCFCSVIDDGAGIYTAENSIGNVISGNIILNGIGAANGTANGIPSASGIYIDNHTTNVTFQNNTVSQTNHGLFIHNSHEITVTGNTLYNNDIQLYLCHDSSAINSPLRNIILTNNILFSKTALQIPIDFYSIIDDVPLFGSANHNFYIRPFENNIITRIHNYTSSRKEIYDSYSFEGWKTTFDQNASETPVDIPGYSVNSLIGSNKFPNGNFNSNVNGTSINYTGNAIRSWDGTGKIDGGTLKLEYSTLSTQWNSTNLLFNIGSIDSGTNYVLKFSCLGTIIHKSIEVFLRSNEYPFDVITTKQYFNNTTSRTDYELLFSPTLSANSANLYFVFSDANEVQYLDNILFFEAEVSKSNSEEFIRFEYNPYPETKTIALSDPYIDATGTTCTGTVTLLPYTSVVLIKNDYNAPDPNLPPSVQNQSFQLPKTSENETEVGTVQASDQNAGQLLTFTIISGNTNEIFAIDPTSGIIKVINSEALYALAASSIDIAVKVQDNGAGLLSSQSIITINLLYDTCIATGYISYQVWNNIGNGIAVSNLTNNINYPNNPSSTTTITSMEGPLNLSDNFGAKIAGYICAPTTGNYTFWIASDDNSELWLSKNVQPVNKQKIASHTSWTNPREWNKYSTQKSSLISLVGGQSYYIEAIMKDGIGSDNFAVGWLRPGQTGTSPSEIIPGSVLSPLDISSNQAPVISNQIFYIIENSQNGTHVGNVVASDPNPGQVLTYSLNSGNINNAFVIDSLTGTLTVGNSTALNYESLSEFSLIVNVHDNGTTSLSSQATIQVNILNTNEQPVIINQTLTLNTNSPDGTNIGVIAATDPDAGQALTFTILSGNINNAFTINPTTGLLTLTNSSVISYPATPSFSLEIKVQDDGTGLLSNQATITLNLQYIGCFATGTISYQIWNNIGSGTTITNLTSNTNFPDNPSSTSLLTSMEGITNIADNFGARLAGFICAPATGDYTFWIASDDNGELWLSTNDQQANKSKIAYHTLWTDSREWNKFTTQKSSVIHLVQGQNYYVEALMEDGSGLDNLAVGWLKPGQSGTIPSEVIPGSVLSPLGTFVNVAPTIANQTFAVNENSLTGTYVGNVIATDPNIGQALTYSIISGNTSNAFSINTLTGELFVANSSALNYEALMYFNLIVNVQDNGTTSLNSQAMVNINVLNINESPLILPQIFTINANQTNGIVVGAVSATDPDAGQTLTFSILTGNSNNAFTINSSTGVLVLENFLDLGLTTTNAFPLVIKVQDDGYGQLVNQATIIVYLENLYGCGSVGNITYQVWNNIGLGTDVSDLTNSMYYPFNPTYSTVLTTMEAPGNFSESFGARIAGYICAPATGNYSFWIASDDNSELWLSTDNQTTNVQKIAFVTSWTNPREWNKFPSQKSAQINLVKGQNYYIEALMKDGNGSDNLAVGWLKPGQSGTLPSEVIPGSVLSPMGTTLPILVSTIGLPSNQAITEGSELLLTALILPLNATNRNLNWTSNNPSVATVNSNGVVNGVSVGITMIVATSTDGSNISEYCQITVNHPPCTSSGNISYQVWNNIGNGITVQDLTNNISFPNSPSYSSLISSMEGTSNLTDFFGARMAGYICAPLTGNYTFWIASDDNGELWLSANDQPENKQKAAYHTSWTNSREWNKFPTQKSNAHYFIQGQRYYIEALMKDGNGSDNFAVGWAMPGQTDTVPSEVIPGSVLSPIETIPPILVSSISLPPACSILENSDSSLAVIVLPPDADNRILNWTSSNSAIATVNNSGVISGVTAGKVIIYASSTDGSNLSDSCIVTVYPPCNASGSILYQVWNNAGNGETVSELTNNPNYPNNPNSTVLISSMEGTTNLTDFFGARMAGYICAPFTGSYTFWIASDDNGELWLSIDDNPANKQKIAYHTSWTNPFEWNKFQTQKSLEISLKQGHQYYIEALMKDGNGSDNFAVGWLKPGQTDTIPSEVIPGSVITPLEPAPPVLITTINLPLTASTNELSTFSINASVLPDNATNQILKWTSSNTAVAVVDNSGIVSGLAGGTAIINATSTDGTNISGTCQLTVISPPCMASGNISYQVWNEIGSGEAVSDLTNNINYPNNPTSTSLLPSMEGITNLANRFGALLAGYICAPTTGSYIFWIASDDNGELWLSTNDDPANKQRIAYHTSWTNAREWNKFDTQKSIAVNLIQGQSYYIEALMKDGNGSDNLSVGWLKPGQTGNEPSEIIPGSVLSALSSKSVEINAKMPVLNDGGIILSIYPNPLNTNILHIMARNMLTKTTLKVYSVSGVECYSTTLENSETLLINRSVFKNGIYIVKVINNDFVKSVKLIVD